MNTIKYTLKDTCESALVCKKSRFIATISPQKDEKGALEFISKIKKEHQSARHNVYAYIINKNNQERIRFTDDGEPSHTAGKPVLEMLQFHNLQNVACVVTRYFGGTLLGTGGLVRAYGGVVKNAIEEAESNGLVIPDIERKSVEYTCDYKEVDRIKKEIEENGGVIDSISYAEKVSIVASMPVV